MIEYLPNIISIMKTKVSNRVNMIHTTISYCVANTAVTAGIPMVGVVLGQIIAKMELVNSLNQKSIGTSVGVTLDTNGLRQTMVELALKCGCGTLAYANSVKNNTLAAKVNYSETDLDLAKKEEVDDLCQNIHDGAAAHLLAISDFGVLAGDVAQLQSAIDLYRASSQNPRQAIVNRSGAIQQLEGLVREVIGDLLAGQLDNLVNTLKLTQPDFCRGYFLAREIIDLGRTTAKIRGKVLDEQDVPLKEVQFSIYKAGTNELLAKHSTDVKGRFNISNLKAGVVDLFWSKEGYKTVEERGLKIVSGKEVQRKRVVLVMSYEL